MSVNIYKLLRRASRITGRSYRSLKKSWQTLDRERQAEYKQRLIEKLNNIDDGNNDGINSGKAKDN